MKFALEFCKEICRVIISVVKSGLVNRHTLIKGVKQYLSKLSTLLDNWDKIQYNTFPRNAVSYCRFREYRCSISPTLLKEINGFCFYFLQFSSDMNKSW